jgi:putative two-component system response regulator
MKKPLILAVDDARELLALMAKVLAADYEVKTASGGAAALLAAATTPLPDLVLLDVEMPGMSGFEVCKALKENPATAAIPVIFLTGKGESKDEMQGLTLGAVDYVAKPINVAVLKARVRTHLALANRRAELERLVRERTAKLEAAHLELIRCLGRALECHESAAAGKRFQRMGLYAKLVAQAAGARPAACEMLEKATPMHDIGKLAVPAEILRRSGELSAPDWERVKRHPEYGAAIIGQHEDPLLNLARVIALTHHERWDGTGYPKGLKGDAIPWPGRLVAVIDAFEAMTTTQFHHEPLTIEQAAQEILRNAGTRYDPAITEAFKKALPAMRKVRAAIGDALGDIINLDFRQAADPAQARKKNPATVAASSVAAAKK